MRSPVSVRPTKVLPLVWLVSMLLSGLAAPVIAADVTVPTTVVQTGRTGRSLDMDGAIQPVRQATVSAQTAGNVLAQGSADSIMKNEAVIEAYLGTGLKNKVAAEIATETASGESHGAQPGLGDEARGRP